MPPSAPCRTAPSSLFVLGLLAAACSSDKTVAVLAQPPNVTIESPAEGSSVYENVDIEFRAKAITKDGDGNEALVASWVANDVSMCTNQPVNVDGSTTCLYAFDQKGEAQVEVTVSTPGGDTAKAVVTLNVVDNSAPTIDILSPADGERYAVEELIIFNAMVADTEEDPQDLVVSVNSSLDGDLELGGTPASSGDYSAGGYLSAGTHLITMRVEDASGENDQEAITVVIYEHGPPTIETVGILPSPPFTEDTLSADPQGWSDPDSSAEKYYYRWFKMDSTGAMVEDTTEATSTYPAAKTTKHDLIQVEVTPYNDYGEGAARTSASVEILNSPPEAPEVTITPSSPEPDDNLYCAIVTPSFDADGDPVTYRYTWNRNGAPTTQTTNVVTADAVEHGDTWDCFVTPNDGEDDGDVGSASTSTYDVTSPGAPAIDRPNGYRNETSVTLTGTCEAGCALTFYCGDSATTWTLTDTCDATGTFEYTDSTHLSRGDTAWCYADCVDAAGNASVYSNTVTTEVCDPYDPYEDSAGYGDSGANPVDAFSVLADTGTSTIVIEANILSDDLDGDWYVISTSDDVASDRTMGINYYNFEVAMVDGSSDYNMYVYKDTYDPTDLECPTAGAYTEYSDFAQDRGDSVHAVPSDTRSCGTGSSVLNDCEDLSHDYYIYISRKSSTVSSCQAYRLEITNGVW